MMDSNVLGIHSSFHEAFGSWLGGRLVLAFTTEPPGRYAPKSPKDFAPPSPWLRFRFISYLPAMKHPVAGGSFHLRKERHCACAKRCGSDEMLLFIDFALLFLAPKCKQRRESIVVCFCIFARFVDL